MRNEGYRPSPMSGARGGISDGWPYRDSTESIITNEKKGV